MVRSRYQLTGHTKSAAAGEEVGPRIGSRKIKEGGKPQGALDRVLGEGKEMGVL